MNEIFVKFSALTFIFTPSSLVCADGNRQIDRSETPSLLVAQDVVKMLLQDYHIMHYYK